MRYFGKLRTFIQTLGGAFSRAPQSVPTYEREVAALWALPAADIAGSRAAAAPEPVRLVIWDLDDTFWDGTLSEAGMAWRAETAEAVRELARRGIVSSICSKNDHAAVEAELRRYDLWDYFVFPSIDWNPKGPRLQALVEAVQLRPATILFIDDNPMNRAEARHFLPDLQVADETIVPHLLADPRLRGKADAAMGRLAQYRLLQRRHQEKVKAGGDTSEFLRQSNITVAIQSDIEANIDRAVELINRTNQLNFTKARLPEDAEQARAQLRTLISGHGVQAGLLHVRDNYGDYGYCGLYIIYRPVRPEPDTLLHFAFSCRILGMGIETWLYRRLGRPALNVVGEVLSDVINDTRTIDWVSVELAGLAVPASSAPKPLAYVLARGGCDMRALTHYFDMVSDRIVEEMMDVRAGKSPMVSASVMATHAIQGAPPQFVRDAAKLGFLPQDFQSLISNPPDEAPGVWLLNFTLEQGVPMLQHKATGMLIPAFIPGFRGPPRRMLRAKPEDVGMDPDVVRDLAVDFQDFGALPDERFSDAVTMILAAAPAGVQVFILLANQQRRLQTGEVVPIKAMAERNGLIEQSAAPFGNVTLIRPMDHMTQAEQDAMNRPHHYDRMVYFRMFQHIMAHLAKQQALLF